MNPSSSGEISPFSGIHHRAADPTPHAVDEFDGSADHDGLHIARHKQNPLLVSLQQTLHIFIFFFFFALAFVFQSTIRFHSSSLHRNDLPNRFQSHSLLRIAQRQSEILDIIIDHVLLRALHDLSYPSSPPSISTQRNHREQARCLPDVTTAMAVHLRVQLFLKIMALLH